MNPQENDIFLYFSVKIGCYSDDDGGLGGDPPEFCNNKNNVTSHIFFNSDTIQN